MALLRKSVYNLPGQRDTAEGPSVSQMEKPNTPPFGGKGLFGFCLEEEYQLEDPLSILHPIWRTVTREVVNGLITEVRFVRD